MFSEIKLHIQTNFEQTRVIKPAKNRIKYWLSKFMALLFFEFRAEIFSDGEHGIFFRFVDREVIIEKEMTSYSALSFLADIGGSLGMFLGFSFLMVWDGVEAVLITIRQVWRQKKNEHTMIVP